MTQLSFFRLVLLSLLAVSSVQLTPLWAQQADKISVLLIDGQNNHNWKATTPLIQQVLEGCGRFDVDVATAPGPEESMDSFSPEFSKYDLIVSNYNGQLWSKSTQKAFEAFVAGGGGFVSVHAADNSFPKWESTLR